MADWYGYVSSMLNDIRLLPDYEVPLLLPLARAFYAEGNLPGALNEKHFVETLKNQINVGSCFVIVGGSPIRGTIAGIVFDDMMTSDRCCMECFWYVSSSERGSLGLRLLDAWENEALQRNASRLVMAHLHSENDERFTKLYGRRGYTMREQIFVKEAVL